MDDKGSFFTRALAMLGLPPYVAGSEPAKACEDSAQAALALAFEYTAWTFAQRRATLMTDAAGRVTLPDDCLRLSECSLAEYSLEGREIVSALSGEQRVSLIYTTDCYVQRVELPPQQPLFAEAAVTLLASMIAPRVTDEVKLGAELRQMAERLLARARLKDAQQVNNQECGYVERVLRKGGFRRG